MWQATTRCPAELCTEAEKIVALRVEDELPRHPDLGQMGLSTVAREALDSSSEGHEIERIAAQLMPNQAD